MEEWVVMAVTARWKRKCLYRYREVRLSNSFLASPAWRQLLARAIERPLPNLRPCTSVAEFRCASVFGWQIVVAADRVLSAAE